MQHHHGWNANLRYVVWKAWMLISWPQCWRVETYVTDIQSEAILKFSTTKWALNLIVLYGGSNKLSLLSWGYLTQRIHKRSLYGLAGHVPGVSTAALRNGWELNLYTPTVICAADRTPLLCTPIQTGRKIRIYNLLKGFSKHFNWEDDALTHLVNLTLSPLVTVTHTINQHP